jgi:metal-responsive CopG/Arc/MetJ family transcriptional regulator
MEEERIILQLELPRSLAAKIDDLKSKLGLKSRGDLIERLLQDLFKEEPTKEVDNAE